MRIRSGQTILELILAAGVIVTSISASATLIISTITSGRVGQSNVEAANFAREGIEIVRSIRDSNWLKGERNVEDDSDGITGNEPTVAWDDSGQTNDGYRALGVTGSATYYVVEIIAASPANSGWYLRRLAGNTPTLIRDSQGFPGGYHTQTVGSCTGCTNRRYARVISIQKERECVSGCPAGQRVEVDRLHIISTVLWQDRTGRPTGFTGYNRKLVAEGYLYKWR